MPIGEDERKGWTMFVVGIVVLSLMIWGLATFAVKMNSQNKKETDTQRIDIHGDQHKALDDIEKGQ